MAYKIKIIKDADVLPEDVARELAKRSLMGTDYFAAIFGKLVKGKKEYFKPILVSEQELHDKQKDFLKREDSEGVLYVIYRHNVFDSKLFEVEYVDGEAYIEIDDKEVDEFLKKKLIETAQSPRLFEKHRSEILDMFEDDLQKYADDLFYKQGKGEVFKDSVEFDSLLYKKLYITYVYLENKATDEHPDEYDEEEILLRNYEYELPKEDIVEELCYFVGNDPEFKDKSQEEIEKYVLENYDKLKEKYNDLLLKRFKYAAKEKAEGEYAEGEIDYYENVM